ncbi:hypothetical protein CNECB9_4670017 [Cupriavidus necator]|uniref:Uncharacterized protein n=1 Tax=Cupriavidus necator TaxID=106590 RepID=A0A1K0JGW5_CUPNE|nr:hypothetical protein CNECB9_4670017 [Cupriavidus necator]
MQCRHSMTAAAIACRETQRIQSLVFFGTKAFNSTECFAWVADYRFPPVPLPYPVMGCRNYWDSRC